MLKISVVINLCLRRAHQLQKKTAARNKVPEAGPETRKAPAKKVDVAPTEVNKDGTLKKKKGRPKGSKNKPKLVETVAALTA